MKRERRKFLAEPVTATPRTIQTSLPRLASPTQICHARFNYANWNQDDNRPLMVNCQLAIDATTRENGCIQFVPGSHKWGLQAHERGRQKFRLFLPGHYYERDDAVAVEMEPGAGVFFNALIIHGSAANTSTRSRRMNTFAYNVTGNGVTQCREALRGKPL